PSAGGGKILSACDYGVPILTENEFLELLKEIESRGDHDAAFANLQGYLYSSTEAYEKALSTAPTFKLKDGKQIRAVMVKDFGAGYVIRNSDGKYLTISKGDVSEIRTPSN
ncbi:MAG: hypothetical protein HY291_01715, partial [Planctomycetes bacterium]|nr:hypothetical protein [Planctomycetota bacterium]